MRQRYTAIPLLLGFLAAAAPALAASTAVTSGPNGTTVTSNKPCRVVTRHGDGASSSNSTSITAGSGGVSGSTTVSPGGNGTSVTVGSGSNNGGDSASSAAGSDCVIYRNEK